MDILQMTSIKIQEKVIENCRRIDAEGRELLAERKRLLAEKERIAESRRQNKIERERLLNEIKKNEIEAEQIADQKTRNKPFINNSKQYEEDKEEVKNKTEKEKISVYRKELRKKYLAKIEARIGNKNQNKYNHIKSNSYNRIKNTTTRIKFTESVDNSCENVSEHNFYEFKVSKKFFTNQLEAIESSKKAKQEEKIKTEIKTETKKDDKDFK